MTHRVLFCSAFIAEWKALSLAVKERAGEVLDHLEEEGPLLGRPDVDHLHGSIFPNMKEIRVKAEGQVWRFAFAFDPARQAVVLCGGAKQGMSQALFYRRLIELADRRFSEWIGGTGK